MDRADRGRAVLVRGAQATVHLALELGEFAAQTPVVHRQSVDLALQRTEPIPQPLELAADLDGAPSLASLGPGVPVATLQASGRAAP